MSHPQPGDTVSFTYTGTLDNGEVFSTTNEKNPMRVIIGSNDIPPTLEQTLTHMRVGEQKKVTVPTDEGYGPRQKDLLQTIDNPKMIASLQPKPGMVLALKVEKDGVEQKVPATVIEVNGSRITVDYNHPLAGHNLTYNITLLDIQKTDKQP